jgi:antitoxin VapB
MAMSIVAFTPLSPFSTFVPQWRREARIAMALNIKNSEVERLVEEVAKLAGESKTDAVRQALVERRDRLKLHRRRRARGDSFVDYLEREVWPRAEAAGVLGRRLTRKDEDRILGYGKEGV